MASCICDELSMDSSHRCGLQDSDAEACSVNVGGGSREDEHALRQRRALLMDAFAASMRIPDTAILPRADTPPRYCAAITMHGLQPF